MQQNGYILFAMMSALLSGAAAVYIWQRRAAPGASSLALLVFSTAIWSGAYAMELAGTEEQIKRFWLKFQYLGIAFLPLWGARFGFHYTGYGKWLTRRRMAAFSILPVITLVLNWTNEWHRLFYREIEISTIDGVAVLALTKGVWYWVHIANVYVTYLLMSFFILQMFWRKGRLYRIQAFTLVIAMLPPIAGNLLYLSNSSPFPNLDLSPFAFSATGILIFWGLYRYRLFDVVPVARDFLIECMGDGVIVLDPADCVVDINPAARRLLGVEISSAIGRNIDMLLPDWTDFPACSPPTPNEQRTQLKKIIKEDTDRHIDLRVIHLTDRKGTERGKLLTLRDVTAEKQLEAEREELINRLRDALARVKMLSGLLPICAGCKKIRDDKGHWHQVEEYIHKNSEAKFSHAICPGCLKKLYPELEHKRLR